MTIIYLVVRIWFSDEMVVITCCFGRTNHKKGIPFPTFLSGERFFRVKHAVVNR